MDTARSCLVTEPANNARGSAIELAADESGGACEFVGDGFNTGFQLVAVRIASAAVIAQRLHPGNADGEFCEAFAPGAAEAVGDDHGNREASVFLDFTVKIGGGAIGIFG